MSRNSLSFRAIIYVFSKLILQCIVFFSAPVFTRLLTREEYGGVTVYSTCVAFMMIMTGIQTHGTLNNAKVKYSDTEFEEYSSNAMKLSLLVFVVVSGVIYVFRRPLFTVLSVNHNLAAIFMLHSFGYYIVTFLGAYFTARREAVKDLILSVFVSITGVVLSVGLIIYSKYPGDSARIYGIAIPYLIVGAASLYYFLIYKRSNWNSQYIKFCIPLCLPLIFHNLSGVVLNQSDTLMIDYYRGKTETGIYGFCYSIALPISSIWYALNHAWIPEFYLLMSTGQNEKIQKHSKNYMYLFTSLTCGYMLIASEIVKLLADDKYWEGIEILPYVIAGYYFVFLYSFASNYEFYKRKTKFIALGTFVAAISNILLNIVLIPRIGISGAAIATNLAYIFLFLLHDFIARKVMKGYLYSFKFYLSGIIPVSAVFIICYIAKGHWYIRWCMAFVIGIFLIRRIYRQKAIF